MQLPLTSGERRTIITGATLVGLSLGVRAVALPFVEASTHLRDQLEESHLLLERERRLAGAETAYALLLRGAAARPGATSQLLAAATESTAHSELTGILEDAASIAPATVHQIDPLPVETIAEGLSSVAVRVRAESDFEGLARLLSALEGSHSLLTVDELRVSAATPAMQGGSLDDASVEILDLEFLVTAYLLSRSTDLALPVDTEGRPSRGEDQSRPTTIREDRAR